MPGLVANAQNPNAGVNIPASHRTALSTAYDIIDHDGNNIGFITSITATHSRPVTPIRHLNAADGGRVLEQAPSPSAPVSLSINGFGLFNRQNDGSLIQRLGGSVTAKSMKTLEEQSIPFNIIKRVTNPATGAEVELTVYHDCWLTNHSDPVNIGSATVAQTASISVTWTE